MKKCQICGGYHDSWWREARVYHVMLAALLAIRITRKPWWEDSDEPFDNIDWRTAWEVSSGIYLKQ